MEMIIKEIEAKSVITKSNLPVCDFSVNPYTGCEHACKYCYACFMKRFTNHPEEWGEFVDVKIWQPIKTPGKYKGKELFIGSVTDPYQPIEEKCHRFPIDQAVFLHFFQQFGCCWRAQAIFFFYIFLKNIIALS